MLLVWSALLPVVANPIIYPTCVSDYRVNIANAWNLCLGRRSEDKADAYIADQFQEQKETKESDVL